MTAVYGTSVDITTQDGTADAYLVHPDGHADGDSRHPAVLLYMDAFGLRPPLEKMADRLAEAGYTVLVPNVFFRHGRAPVVELPEFIDPAARPEIFQQLGLIIQLLTPRPGDARRRGLPALAGRQPSGRRRSGRRGVGSCMGARWALRTAGTYPQRVAAVAGFHGGSLATDADDSPHLVADRIAAEVYFGHADQDPSLSPEQIDRLDKAFAAAGLRYWTEVYGGAHHGYTQVDTAAYNAEAAERHWTMLLALLHRAI